MESPKLALCIVGCGSFARTFARSIQEVRGEIDLFFASRDAGRAQDYCRRFQGQGWFGSYQSAAADPRVEAMYLCTPHHLHREHAELAARHGKHILLEKPIARTVAEGQEIIRAAAEAKDGSKDKPKNRAGVTLMVAENIRFLAQVRRCKELVESGAIGNLRLIQLQEEYPFTPGGWRSDRERNGGGVFIDGGIHKVHLLRYLAGEPETIFAAELPKAMAGFEGEDGLIVVARWPTGAVGLINHSWTAAANPAPSSVAVSGTAGRIYFEMGSRRLSLYRGERAETWQLDADGSGLPAMVREFRDSIRQQREPEVSGAAGLRDLELTLAAYESARRGAVLPVSWPEPMQ